MIQRRAARYACNRWHSISSVTEMVSHLGWEPLITRRRNMRLCMMYNIAHTVVGDPWTEWLTTTKRVTRGFHAWKYIPIYSQHNIYTFSFIPRTIIDWNTLSPHSVDSPSIDTLGSRVMSRTTSAPTGGRARKVVAIIAGCRSFRTFRDCHASIAFTTVGAQPNLTRMFGQIWDRFEPKQI